MSDPERFVGDDHIAEALFPRTPAADVALLARTLHREGYDDHTAGHISVRQDDDTLLVTPRELLWDELRASDVVPMDLDGRVLGGRWNPVKAIEVHLALHRAGTDAKVIVHNHPRWATTWAALRRIPPAYDQTSSQTPPPVLVDEYDGTVADPDRARHIAEMCHGAPAALLAHHGVLVFGATVEQAVLRAVTLEWRCRQAWQVESLGGDVPLDPEVGGPWGERVDRIGFPGLAEALFRREVRRDPTVLL